MLLEDRPTLRQTNKAIAIPLEEKALVVVGLQGMNPYRVIVGIILKTMTLDPNNQCFIERKLFFLWLT